MDEQSSNNSEKVTVQSLFASLPPKFAFWAGIIAATAIISLVGFIVMIVLTFSDSDIFAGKSGSKAAPAAPSNVNAAADATSAPTGTLDKSVLRNVRGEGKYTIVEFSDLDCSFCKSFHPTMQQVLKDYDGKVKWAYNHFPLSIHPGAQLAAEASECAAEQGKFWEYIDAHFAGTGTNLTIDQHVAAAGKIGADTAKMKTCLDGKGTQAVVTADADLAQSLGAQGTPFAVIIDEDRNIVGSIPGAYPLAKVKTTLDAIVK